MKKLRLFASVMLVALTTVICIPTVQASPYYYGGCGGYGGWYGSGIPNGLGWTLFGISAAAVLAAVTAPFIARPVYAVPAPGYGAPGYYQGPPQSAVATQSAPPVRRSSGTLAKAQSKLTGMGYYRGAIDGSYGPQTAQAVQQFQADNNLPVSGRLDLKTLSSLGIAP